MLRIKTMPGSAEDRRKVKTETIHRHFVVPIYKAIQNQRPHPGMISIQGIAATSIIDIAVGMFGLGAVIGQVINAFEAQ